jgi:hypothetical protein
MHEAKGWQVTHSCGIKRANSPARRQVQVQVGANTRTRSVVCIVGPGAGAWLQGRTRAFTHVTECRAGQEGVGDTHQHTPEGYSGAVALDYTP